MRKLANAALACALLGCGTGARSHAPQVAETSGSGGVPATPLPLQAQGEDCCQSCPLALEGVKLQFAEVGAGPVMIFTTDEQSDEEELRRRVAELAEFHNEHPNKLAMLHRPHHAEMKPIEGGARLDLLPGNSFDQPSGFTREVEREVKWMQEGHCPPLGDYNECVACDLPQR